jgi:hypothetical protein
VDNPHERDRNSTSFDGVRWDNLFDDLEGQLEYELNAEEVDLRAEEERLRLGRLSMRDRLMSLCRPGAQGGAPGGVPAIVVVLGSGKTMTILPSAFGKDWLAAELLAESAAGVSEGSHPQCVLPLAAIAGVLLNRHQVDVSLDPEVAAAPRIVDRIGLPFVLRDLCRRRKALEVHTPTGTLNGTIDRVGRDHIDLAVHAPGTLRRSREVAHYRMVPLAQIQLVRLG